MDFAKTTQCAIIEAYAITIEMLARTLVCVILKLIHPTLERPFIVREATIFSHHLTTQDTSHLLDGGLTNPIYS